MSCDSNASIFFPYSKQFFGFEWGNFEIMTTKIAKFHSGCKKMFILMAEKY